MVLPQLSLVTVSRSSEELTLCRTCVQTSSWSTNSSPSSHPFTQQLSSHGARSPSQELRHVEQQARKTREAKTAAADPLTPPATPHGQDGPLRKGKSNPCSEQTTNVNVPTARTDSDQRPNIRHVRPWREWLHVSVDMFGVCERLRCVTHTLTVASFLFMAS